MSAPEGFIRKDSSTCIGVLALQGGFVEHERILAGLGVEAIAVRTVQDLEVCQALIIPGGESTVMSMFLWQSGLADEIIKRNQAGDLPVFGTCAGAIMLAREVIGDDKVRPLGLIDLAIERNAYGTQKDSFVADLKFADRDIQAMFIRAPKFKDFAPDLRILAEFQGEPAALASDRVLAVAFHPELVGEAAVHEWWLKLID